MCRTYMYLLPQRSESLKPPTRDIFFHTMCITFGIVEWFIICLLFNFITGSPVWLEGWRGCLAKPGAAGAVLYIRPDPSGVSVRVGFSHITLGVEAILITGGGVDCHYYPSSSPQGWRNSGARQKGPDGGPFNSGDRVWRVKCSQSNVY